MKKMTTNSQERSTSDIAKDLLEYHRLREASKDKAKHELEVLAERSKLYQAFLDGLDIEERLCSGRHPDEPWFVNYAPNWNWDRCQYRIAEKHTPADGSDDIDAESVV